MDEDVFAGECCYHVAFPSLSGNQLSVEPLRLFDPPQCPYQHYIELQCCSHSIGYGLPGLRCYY